MKIVFLFLKTLIKCFMQITPPSYCVELLYMKFRANGKINLSSSELSKIAETTDLADAKYYLEVQEG
jgi:hypothetical protein